MAFVSTVVVRFFQSRSDYMRPCSHCDGEIWKRNMGCLPFLRVNRLGRPLNNGKGVPKSANQPDEIALTICNSISRNCFRLMRDRKRESLANGKSGNFQRSVPNGKRGLLLQVSAISEQIFRKITVPFEFLPKFSDFLGFLLNGKYPWSLWLALPMIHTNPSCKWSCLKNPLQTGLFN